MTPVSKRLVEDYESEMLVRERSKHVSDSSTQTQETTAADILSSETLGNEIVQIYVGQKRKHFSVHKKLICDRSKYFNGAFNRGFMEAGSGELYLPEDYSADAFDHLIDFIYRKALPHYELNDYTRFVALYHLAHQLGMDDLMNDLIDDVRKKHMDYNCCFGPRASKLIYSNSDSGSKLRALAAFEIVVDLHEASWHEFGDTKEFEDKYAEFFNEAPEAGADFFRAQCRYTQEVWNHTTRKIPHAAADECDFHIHLDGKVSCAD
ncbi:POZ [Glarea lozoyensis ATCC 20868]|uniref:POZ n=1 Tax=Glarea lozoyensis (strain ATCC 20868 / MF5171) TaxID=1116229 RepID=S3CRJ2_GLAL2|nr:POZ [Glarea lozoyensis ATCC 20868]EPE29097.1 POZ [Glarea lozoyensis ATCC 20868]